LIPFTHLHVHSEFSLLDGLAHLPELCRQAKQLGMNSLALTDHGQMYGMVKFKRAAADADIKPIFGCEVYQAPRRMVDKEPGMDSRAYHLVLLAQNTAGYRNLLKLVTLANKDGFYYRPRIDRELLAEHADGLICLSACLSGQVAALINEKRDDEAREAVGWFRELFGRDRYYLELQRHTGLPELDAVNEQLVRLAREFDLRLVATNDVHYISREDAKSHDLLLAMQTDTVMSDPKRMRMGSDDFYLMSPDEIAALFPEQLEALENTAMIAEMCDAEIISEGYHLPRFEVPAPYTAETYLRDLCEQGIKRRYPALTPEISQRLDYELGIIHKMGFDDYFLITWDVVNWAKNIAKMLVGPGRGSVGASIVAYLLGITELEPLGLDLPFERFLNPSRKNMPDIDLDYPEDRRGEVIAYLTQRYGEERTAQIAAFDTMAAKGAVRDVGRALEIAPGVVDMVTKLLSGDPKKRIEDELEENADLRSAYETQDDVRRLIDEARPLQGLARHLTTHAAGILIADEPLVTYAPMQRAPHSNGVLSQFCMEDVEASGLLKLDILGLSTLTMIDRTFRWIEKTRGKTYTLADVPLDDPESYALLCSGEVTGLFQVESEGMRRTLRDMQPSEHKDITAALALYRPGPMQYIPNYINRKFGREPVEYRHPKLEPSLSETYGIIVYQEQVIRLVSDLAKFTAAEADILRRAIGKKKQKDIDEQKAKFVAGAVANGIAEQTANDIFSDIEKFANYGFNKPHGAAYAMITLQTAYLKAHYPAEFLAAIMSVERDNLTKVAGVINECRRLNIDVRPPDVNRSEADFILEPADQEPSYAGELPLLGIDGYAVRYGLAAIKNCGMGPANAIVQARGDQPFSDVADFARRVDLRLVNKRSLESLIKAGALDSLGSRGSLLAGIDSIMAESQRCQREKECGQRSLFDLDDSVACEGITFTLPTEYPEYRHKQQLSEERVLLGTYLSGHPLNALRRQPDQSYTLANTLDDSTVGQKVSLAGVITDSHVHITKKGDKMAFGTFEDLSGALDLVIFPRAYDAAKELLEDTDKLLVIEGKADFRAEKPQVMVDSISEYLTEAPENGRRAKLIDLRIELGTNNGSGERQLENVLNLLAINKGEVPYQFSLLMPEGSVKVAFPQAGTQVDSQLERQCINLLGADAVTIEWD